MTGLHEYLDVNVDTINDSAQKGGGEPPPDSEGVRSVLEFIIRARWSTIPIVLLVVSWLWWPQYVAAAGLAGAIYTLYRSWFAWRNRPISASAESGSMSIGERGPWWLLLTTSSKDSAPLNADWNTPSRGYIQRLFRCGNIKVGNLTVKNVRIEQIEEIAAIHSFLTGIEVNISANNRTQTLAQLFIARMLDRFEKGALPEIVRNLRDGVSLLREVVVLLREIRDQRAGAGAARSAPAHETPDYTSTTAEVPRVSDARESDGPTIDLFDVDPK